MSGATVRWADVVQPYDGNSDFEEWICKLEVVAKLQGIDNVGNCLPVFLTKGEFAVYQGLNSDVQKDYKALRKSLLTAFSISATRAYGQFVQRQMRPDEKVDVYLADLTRLFGIITTAHNEDFLKCAFVNSLPASVKSQLITSSNFSDMH
ncbi:hypothetical protein GJ496_005709 [Pomphorhynchus laevis]|nr:hypothetical protein GJ496_005709 [Pomphorhynchus laevis]